MERASDDQIYNNQHSNIYLNYFILIEFNRLGLTNIQVKPEIFLNSVSQFLPFLYIRTYQALNSEFCIIICEVHCHYRSIKQYRRGRDKQKCKRDTPFCLQYSSSVQQSSFLTISAGHLGLGITADTEEVTTTRRTPSFFAAVSTLMVPFIAGSNRSR